MPDADKLDHRPHRVVKWKRRNRQLTISKSTVANNEKGRATRRCCRRKGDEGGGYGGVLVSSASLGALRGSHTCLLRSAAQLAVVVEPLFALTWSNYPTGLQGSALIVKAGAVWLSTYTLAVCLPRKRNEPSEVGRLLTSPSR